MYEKTQIMYQKTDNCDILVKPVCVCVRAQIKHIDTHIACFTKTLQFKDIKV